MSTSPCTVKVPGFPAEGGARKKENWEEQKKGFSVSVTAAVSFSETAVPTLTNIALRPGCQNKAQRTRMTLACGNVSLAITLSPKLLVCG